MQNTQNNVSVTNTNTNAITAQINALDAQIMHLVSISAVANAKNAKLIDKALKRLFVQRDVLIAQL